MGSLPRTPAQLRYDVFLSHASIDKPAVENLARRLRDESGLNPFLDKWHLVPGQPWQSELEEALDRSACAAVFVGAGAGPWRDEEMQLALSKAVRTHDDYRVIPVLLPGGSPDRLSGFLGLRTWVDFTAGIDDADAYARLVAGIRGEPSEIGSYSLPDEPTPYRGLLAFEAEHASFFFGRSAETQRLAQKLANTPFVAVIGASGSGKSSIVRAGLLPTIARTQSAEGRWRTLVVRPGADPLRALAEPLAKLGPADRGLPFTDELCARLATRTDGLRTAISGQTDSRVLVVIDQFEELFTQAQANSPEVHEAAVSFAENLYDSVTRSNGRVRVVITLRADFVDHCLELPRLAELLEGGQILLGPLNDDALREAILQPARKVGAFFEKGLVQIMLRDVASQPGALPLIQHVLLELWNARRGPWLTLEAYERSGGVAGALHRRAQLVYDSLSADEQEIARYLFLRLVSVSEGTPDARRSARREELRLARFDRATVDRVIARLSGSEARLIVADERVIEIAHEALLRNWTTLRKWIDENRQTLLVHSRLTLRAAEWEARARDEALCYDEFGLTELRRAWSTLRGSLTAVEEQFVLASWQALMRRRRGRVYWGAILLSAGLAINALLVGMVFAEGPGVAAMYLVPPPLGFGIGGLIAQQGPPSLVREYSIAVICSAALEGLLMYFFAAIWQNL
jgi:energy-coupling factor transporter ATP-binding protein EcfA2